ncbi:MAG: sulfite exporter TauE/SafE family protein [Candidatus Peregrinibacteria bacterium]
MSSLVLLVAVCAVTYSFEIVFGLAGTILMLPVLSFFFDVKTLVVYSVLPQMLVGLIALGTSYSYKTIDFTFFFKILAFAFLGAGVGIILFESLPLSVFRLVLATAITLSGLYMVFKPKHFKLGRYTVRFLDFIAGISHTLLGISGPIVATRLVGTFTDKTEIRNYTLAFFLSMNVVRLGGYLVRDTITPAISNMMLWSAPFLIVVLLFANRLHYKISNLWFHRVVAFVILLSGIILFFK